MNRELIKELRGVVNTEAGQKRIQALQASKQLSTYELKEIYKIDSDNGMIEKINDLNLEK